MVTDFWGVVVPNYIAALGGFAGTVVAVISLFIARASRTKTEQVAFDERDLRATVIDVLAELDKWPTVTGEAHSTLPPVGQRATGTFTPPGDAPMDGRMVTETGTATADGGFARFITRLQRNGTAHNS